MLPLTELLPLRSVAVTLRFLDSSTPAFFHQPALGAFLRFMAGDPEGFERLIRFDAPESGRIAYQPGQCYRFHLIGLAGGEAILETLLDNLARLPASSPKSGRALPFRDNLAMAAIHDAISAEPVADFGALSTYGLAALEQEAALWRGFDRFTFEFLSPARLLKDKARREDLRGEARYCRNLGDVDGALLAARLHDSLAELLRARGVGVEPRDAGPALRVRNGHLFWMDAGYSDAEGRNHVMGGMSGRLELAFDEPPPPEWWHQALLGQYLGIGQRGALGLGRYRLRSPEGGGSCRRVLPAASLLSLARDEGNLAEAWRHIRENRAARWKTRVPAEDWDWEEEPPAPDEPEMDGDFPLERLQQVLDRALAGNYRPPPLLGIVLPKPDGGVRPLAVPPFFDRVLQRALVQILAPALDAAQYRHSYGFRPGRSRRDARDALQKAAREGYGWVYESDIEDFFDSVDRKRLEVRLRALYGEDPAVDLVLVWMAQPVEYEGQTLARPAGLPQGSPLSPAMANLMLDDFDGDMEVLGFRLVRFADDFVVLCKDPKQAERAHRAAEASLAEHGLRLNPAKTRIAPAEQGFRYLGYLFVNELAVDVSGHGEETPDPPQIPPHSWLARLGERVPENLAATLTEPPAARPEAENAGGLALDTVGSSRQEPSCHRGKSPHPNPLPTGERETAALESTLPGPALGCGRMDDFGQLLCVTGARASLSTHGGRLRVERDGETVAELPWKHLQAVLLFGSHSLTTPVFQAALREGVPLHFAGAGGGYRGVLWTGRPAEPGAGLWLRQASLFADPALALALSREIVAARIRHLRETLRLRGAVEPAGRLKKRLEAVERMADLAALNGAEGAATGEFFEAVRGWLPAGWGFFQRNRRPPRDPFNALLSMGYTVLHGYVQTLIHADGLLPWQGFYHQPHGGHATLASDLMEPFRHLVERTALAMIQRRELDPGDFQLAAGGACLLRPEARRKFLAGLLEGFNSKVTAYGGEAAVTPLQHIHRQNLSLIRWLTQGEPFQAWRTR